MGMMGDAPSASVGPRNIQFMLNRLTAYSKNTIRLQPQTKSVYFPSDTIAFRLPASALLDLHTATLQFKMTFTDKRGKQSVVDIGANAGADIGLAAPPRFNSGLFKRVDIQMGSTSVGLTGLHDYGALYTLLAHHTIHQDRAGGDLGWTEGGPMIPMSSTQSTFGGPSGTIQGTSQAGRSRYQLTRAQTREDWLQVRNFLGLMGGQYMRFMDTNILPEVTLYFQLAPKHVVASTDIVNLDWQIDNVSLSFESVNFGDGVSLHLHSLQKSFHCIEAARLRTLAASCKLSYLPKQRFRLFVHIYASHLLLPRHNETPRTPDVLLSNKRVFPFCWCDDAIRRLLRLLLRGFLSM